MLVQSKFPSGILKERDCLFLCGLFFSFEGCNYLSCCKTIMYYPIWFFMNVHKFNFHIILSWEVDIQSYVASREEKFFVRQWWVLFTFSGCSTLFHLSLFHSTTRDASETILVKLKDVFKWLSWPGRCTNTTELSLVCFKPRWCRSPGMQYLCRFGSNYDWIQWYDGYIVSLTGFWCIYFPA